MTPRPLESLSPASNIKGVFRLLYPVRVVAFGLAVSQVVATVLVYLSNRALAEKILAIRAAGYGPLPGVNIDPPLSSFEAAFAGGSFFTLSTGAGVVMITFAAVLLIAALPAVYRVFKIAVLNPGRRLLALMVLLPVAAVGGTLAIGWPVLLIMANVHGFCPGLTAFLVLVPPAVIWAALKWRRHTGNDRLAWRNPVHFLLIAILLALWAPHVNKDVFINFKDNLLLTSRPGTAIVDFYYRYTLYPAEVFKRLTDKQLKTCVLEGVHNLSLAEHLEKRLRDNNYFIVPAGGVKADLRLILRGDRLVLGQGEKSVMTVDRKKFITSADFILGRFSEKTDRNALFRRFTIISLVGMAPLVLYLLTYGFFCLITGTLTGIRNASLLAPLLCFVFWTGVMMALDTPPVAGFDRPRAAAALRDGSRKERLAALRYIHTQRLDIADFPGYHRLLETSDFALRYWLISDLGNSRDPGAAEAVNRYLSAGSAYLACKAISATASRVNLQGNMNPRQYRQLLIGTMASDDNWYVQFYAYKALRELGWTPKKSG